MPARVAKQYYVHIVTNGPKTLYVGVTGDLAKRVYQHKQKLVQGFTKKVQPDPAGLVRADFGYHVSHRAREANQGLAKEQENRSRRVVESAMG